MCHLRFQTKEKMKTVDVVRAGLPGAVLASTASPGVEEEATRAAEMIRVGGIKTIGILAMTGEIIAADMAAEIAGRTIGTTGEEVAIGIKMMTEAAGATTNSVAILILPAPQVRPTLTATARSRNGTTNCFVPCIKDAGLGINLWATAKESGSADEAARVLFTLVAPKPPWI